MRPRCFQSALFATARGISSLKGPSPFQNATLAPLFNSRSWNRFLKYSQTWEKQEPRFFHHRFSLFSSLLPLNESQIEKVTNFKKIEDVGSISFLNDSF